MDSILTSMKTLLGITEECEQFDNNLILHINSVFSILTQLGVGPRRGFSIADKTAVWDDFLPMNDARLELVKSYMHSKVRLLFDPPTNSAVMESLNRTINEMEFRILVAVETA